MQHIPSQTMRMRLEEEDAARNQAEARRQTDVKKVIIEITAAQERAFAQALEDYTEMRYATGVALLCDLCLMKYALRLPWRPGERSSFPSLTLYFIPPLFHRSMAAQKLASVPVSAPVATPSKASVTAETAPIAKAEESLPYPTNTASPDKKIEPEQTPAYGGGSVDETTAEHDTPANELDF